MKCSGAANLCCLKANMRLSFDGVTSLLCSICCDARRSIVMENKMSLRCTTIQRANNKQKKNNNKISDYENETVARREIAPLSE